MSEALISRLERLEADVAEIKAILSHLDQRLTSEPPPARRADVAAVLEELERLARELGGWGFGPYRDRRVRTALVVKASLLGERQQAAAGVEKQFLG